MDDSLRISFNSITETSCVMNIIVIVHVKTKHPEIHIIFDIIYIVRAEFENSKLICATFISSDCNQDNH